MNNPGNLDSWFFSYLYRPETSHSPMNLLIVSATPFEVRPFVNKLTPAGSCGPRLLSFTFLHHHIDLLLPGIGMMVTAYHLGRQLERTTYTAAINAGVAGSFKPDLPIGEVAEVVEDCLPELVAEEETGRVSVFELGLMDPDAHPFRGGRLVNDLPIEAPSVQRLRKVKGSTVNTLHGSSNGRSQNENSAIADIESMEGAAFLYSCLSAGIPNTQIRSISNFVNERDKTKWNLNLALKNLNKTLEEIVLDLTKD